MSETQSCDDLPLFSFGIRERPGGVMVDLIKVGCLTCGASVYEVEHQTGDLCPLCDRNPSDAPDNP